MLNFVQPRPVPGFVKRLAQAARYTIRGILPDTWMSPLQPLAPFAPITEPRQYDFAVGRNLFYQPRNNERYSFEDLRLVARQSELVRLAIETRMDQLASMNWHIKPLLENEEVDEKDPRIKEITEFFAKPDKIHDWDQWLRLILEELFVTDAVSLARRKNRGGGLFALEPVDGATIFPLIDQNGRQPLPPDPAFQQIIKGQPKADFTSDELIYYVRKTQVNTPYGWSPVEQIIDTASTDIQRLKYTLAYFSEGSVPDAYITAPDGMSPDKVLAYETHLNALLAGNAVGRRQMPVLVHGMEIKSLKTAELKNEFDEWLARKVCFAFSLPPTAFVKQLNRSTAETDQVRTRDEGQYPVMLYIKRLVDKVIREDWGFTDLEFQWDDNEERDPKAQAEIYGIYVDKGLMARNEVRDELGLDDIAGGDEPMVTTSSGPVPLPGSPLYEKMKTEQANAEAARAERQVTMASTKQPKNEDTKVVDINSAQKVKKKLAGYGAFL